MTEDETDFVADLRAQLLLKTKYDLRTAANDRAPFGAAGLLDPQPNLFGRIGKIAAALVIVAGAGFVGF